MAFNIQEMRSQLQFGGARAANFSVTIQNPVNSVADIKVPFMVKASQLPSSTIGTIEVPYFGAKLKEPGNRVFEEWTVTVINDEDFLVRNALEQWMNSIQTHETNIRQFASTSSTQFKSQGQITQLSKIGVPLREYTFHGIWPASIGAIDVNWESSDTIEEFEVTFQYDWWSVSGGITGNPTS